MRSRRLTASARANAATRAPMVTIWMRERGSGTMVFAPAEPSVLRTSSPQTMPMIFGVPAGRGSAPGRMLISTTGLCAEGAARVLPVRRVLPVLEVEHLARVADDEGPRPDVDVVV